MVERGVLIATRLNGTVPPGRVPNATVRTREHLTPDEVERLITEASGSGRYAHRQATLILLSYRHGLRVGELVALRWEQVDFPDGLLHITRMKRGLPSTHLLHGPELRALRRLQREQQAAGPYVFTSERRGPLTTAAVRKLVTRIGQPPASRSQFILICLGMPVGSSWPTKGTTPVQSSSTWAIGTSAIRCAIQNWPPAGSSSSGRTSHRHE